MQRTALLAALAVIAIIPIQGPSQTVVYGAGGSGTPGGADTQVQFNDSGAFGGDADLTYTTGDDTLHVKKNLSVGENITTGLAWTLGNAGDSGASSNTIRGGDGAANSEPGFFSAYSSDPVTPFRSFMYPCTSGGKWCMSSATPGADSGNFLLHQNWPSYWDLYNIAPPANPLTNYGRLYFDSGTGDLACRDSGGSDCMPSGGSGAFDPATTVEIYEDFIGGHPTAASQIGTHGWKVGTSMTSGSVLGESNHPGIYYIETGTVTDDDALLYLSTNTNQYPLYDLSAAIADVYWWIKMTTITEQYVHVGLSAYPSGGANPKGYYFELDSAVENEWHAITRTSAGEENTDTAVAVSTSWARLRINFASGTVKFYINGVLKATHTTYLATSNLSPALFIKQLGSTEAKIIYTDAFYYEQAISR